MLDDFSKVLEALGRSCIATGRCWMALGVGKVLDGLRKIGIALKGCLSASGRCQIASRRFPTFTGNISHLGFRGEIFFAVRCLAGAFLQAHLLLIN